MDVVEAKEIVRAEIDRLTPTLLEVSHSIHANPELNFEEHHAHDTLTGVLEDQGLAVERGAYDMATAFESRVGADDGPTVAVLCEYDALPGIGHACGHNIIGAAGLGAGLAVAKVAEALGGRVAILGTPAEEGGGGKEFMIRRGAFDDIDLAMMVHPADRDLRTMHPSLQGFEGIHVAASDVPLGGGLRRDDVGLSAAVGEDPVDPLLRSNVLTERSDGVVAEHGSVESVQARVG